MQGCCLFTLPLFLSRAAMVNFWKASSPYLLMNKLRCLQKKLWANYAAADAFYSAKFRQGLGLGGALPAVNISWILGQAHFESLEHCTFTKITFIPLSMQPARVSKSKFFDL